MYRRRSRDGAPRGPIEGGVYVLDHDFLQDGYLRGGLSPDSLTRLTLPNGSFILDMSRPPEWGEDPDYYETLAAATSEYFAWITRDANEMLAVLWDAQDERGARQWDSLGALLDWLTLGIVSGTWEGIVYRHELLVADPSLYNILNAVTFGGMDAVSGALLPEEPWSFEHLLDLLATALLVYGAVRSVKAVAGKVRAGTGGKYTTAELLDELARSGEKHNLQDVVAIIKKDNKIIWLEKGNASAGLEHIIIRHSLEFATMGIKVNDIPDFIMYAIKNGVIVGKQGTRPIYEVTYNGIKYRVAITIGSNGFVVGANPVS